MLVSRLLVVGYVRPDMLAPGATAVNRCMRAGADFLRAPGPLCSRFVGRIGALFAADYFC